MAQIRFSRDKLKTWHLDNSLTPAEIAQLLEGGMWVGLPFAIRPLLQSGQSPVGYIREDLTEGADFYTANRGADRLIVAFCSAGNELGVPISYFLQNLRDDLYDVLILRDPRRLHFDHGVAGLSTSFLETIRQIQSFIAERGFGEVITFGVSMGGYPALRAGLLLNASRAISLGGRYCWHVSRLMSKEQTANAFDLLCHCQAKSNVQLIAAVAAENEPDVKDLKVLCRTFPECVPLMIDTGDHNVTGYFYRVGLLRLFYACLFEYWNRPAASPELLSILHQIARQTDYSQRPSQPRKQIISMRQYLEKQAGAIRRYGGRVWRGAKRSRIVSHIVSRWVSPRGGA
jgi:hypothetical protein